MSTLEEALSKIGDKPLSRTDNYPSLLAFVNGSFSKAGLPPADKNVTAMALLERIYALENTELQDRLLNRAISDLSIDTRFKNTLLIVSMSSFLVAFGIFAYVTISGQPLSQEAVDAFKSIFGMFFDLLKIFTGSTN